MKVRIGKEIRKILSTRKGRSIMANRVHSKITSRSSLINNRERTVTGKKLKVVEHIGLVRPLSEYEMQYVRSHGIKCDPYHIISGTYIVQENYALSDLRDAIQRKIDKDVKVLFDEREFTISPYQ